MLTGALFRSMYEVIGTGQHSKVHKIRKKRTIGYYALKITSKGERKKLMREVSRCILTRDARTCQCLYMRRLRSLTAGAGSAYASAQPHSALLYVVSPFHKMAVAFYRELSGSLLPNTYKNSLVWSTQLDV